MKKLIIGLLLVVVLLMIGACKTESDEEAATKVAKSFFEAMANKDIKTAKKYATEETQKTLDMIEPMLDGLFDDEGAEETEKEEVVASFEVLSVKVDGEKAVASVKMSNSQDPENPQTEEIDMVKEKGTWKVHMLMDKD